MCKINIRVRGICGEDFEGSCFVFSGCSPGGMLMRRGITEPIKITVVQSNSRSLKKLEVNNNSKKSSIREKTLFGV